MKTNPQKKPVTEADVRRAWKRGVEDGVSCATAIILTVFVDKFGGAEHVPDIWAELNKLSEEVAEHRVSIGDLKHTLKVEYGIIV